MTATSADSSLDREIAERLARELEIPLARVEHVLALLAEGNTVPFIARYRKEATGGLDEVQIRSIEERHQYHRDLEARRATILESIREQGKLTPELERAIVAAESKTALEDLYLPHKQKRKTRASMARERGLEPLAEKIWNRPRGERPDDAARAFVTDDVPDVDAALQGARDIVAERVAETAAVRELARDTLRQHGWLESKRVKAKTQEPTKFEAYYDHRERVSSVATHRYLAMRRGDREGMLRVKITTDVDRLERDVTRRLGFRPGSPFDEEYTTAARDALTRLLLPSAENQIHAELTERADLDAVNVFAKNLEELLLAAPLGERAVLGIDPGLRTGCKCAMVDATGKYLATTTIYPVRDESRARQDLAAFIDRHHPGAIAVGNGTGGRETERLAREVAKESGSDAVVVSVNESGASVYSASDVAREEFPDLDLTIRGAISIARRLQDPLAELVKIDPRSIGVGQYQHDVDEKLLARKLGEVVESCVNRVGVELNTASAALLEHVAGIGTQLARKIVEHREKSGPFANRRALLKVGGLGPKAFQQSAGFLRVAASRNPLDASAVHPERYGLVESMAKDLGIPLTELVASPQRVAQLAIERYVSEDVGELTLRDIVDELEKPGRDPRAEFEPPRFRDDVQEIEDLVPDMVLEGVVTNVTHFGAFVDVGVHQDGLVHISELADRFVQDPHEVVQVGERVRVRVLEIDLQRRRIALSRKRAGGDGAS